MIKSLEEYQDRVRDWHKKVKPFNRHTHHGLSGALWWVQFINVDYENMFIYQMKKELCLLTAIDELLKQDERFYLFYTVGWRDSFAPLRRSIIETWFQENTEGVSPWKK